MANEIKLKRGSGSDPSASDLVVGEVAVRTDNGTLFTKKDDGSVAEIGAAAGVSDGDKGDITVSNSGATFTIDSGVIDNANVASNAAIAGSKISPDFGSQDIDTTGDITINNINKSLQVGNVSGDNYVDIRQISASSYTGFSFQHSNASVFQNLQGSTNQYLILGDNDNGNSGTIFGISQTQSGSTYNYLTLSAAGNLNISNNITLGGTVDGRDVASDGSKLDGIESGATADQTASDIKTLLNSSGLVNAQIDASAAIAGSKINPSFGNQAVTSTNSIKLDGSVGDTIIKASGAEIEFTRGASSNITCSDSSGSLNINTGGSNTRMTIAANGQVDFATNVDCNSGLDVTGNITVSGTVDGRDVASDGSKLDGIESGATADQSASEILTLIKTVDGSGSGLDADTLDGISSASFLRSDAADTASENITINGLKVGEWSGGSTYKGIFHSSQSSSEYMMINNDGHTFISATGSHNVYIRNGANDSTNQLIVASGSDGLTWRGNTVFHAGNLDIVSDTSPQLGGDLDTNSHEILLDDDHAVKFGNDTDLTIKHTGSNGAIDNVTGDLYIKTTGSGDDIVLISNDDIELQPQAGEDGLKVKGNGAVEAYFNNVLKVKTQTDHINIGCNLSSNPFDYLRFGASLFGAADIAPHNAGSHTVGLSFRTDSTADTTINPTEAMRISANGNIGAPNGSNIYNASDSRFKQNVTTLDKGLSAINSLRPVSFNWVEGFCDEEKDTLYGFIAQEVQTVDTNLISQFAPGRTITIEETTIENALTVNEKFIIPMLVKAVQELTAKVTALES